MYSADLVRPARCGAVRRRRSTAGGSDFVRHFGCAWPGRVVTYRRGGKLAQTAALTLAQLQAVFFSSARISLGVGLRQRR
jgi:hypothetical protein